MYYVYLYIYVCVCNILAEIIWGGKLFKKYILLQMWFKF